MSASVQHTLSGNTFFIWLFYLFPLVVCENSKGVLKKPAHSSQRARANLFDLKWHDKNHAILTKNTHFACVIDAKIVTSCYYKKICFKTYLN